MLTKFAPPSPQTTLVILLGASEWPYYPDFQTSEAFVNAAHRLRTYFLKSHGFGLPSDNMLDLFDSLKDSAKLHEEIGQFLEHRIENMKDSDNNARDVLLYFIGHGGFIGSSFDFFLATRRTHIDRPRSSSIEILALAETIISKARNLRRYLILDCCFAGAALRGFIQGSLAEVAVQKTFRAFEVSQKKTGMPNKGTTLLCSSDQETPSLLLPDHSCTAFSEALLETLTAGDSNQTKYLSLRTVKELVEDRLHNLHSNNVPRPILHSPDQSDGDLADVPFFPNLAILSGEIGLGDLSRKHVDGLWLTNQTKRNPRNIQSDSFDEEQRLNFFIEEEKENLNPPLSPRYRIKASQQIPPIQQEFEQPKRVHLPLIITHFPFKESEIPIKRRASSIIDTRVQRSESLYSRQRKVSSANNAYQKSMYIPLSTIERFPLSPILALATLTVIIVVILSITIFSHSSSSLQLNPNNGQTFSIEVGGSYNSFYTWELPTPQASVPNLIGLTYQEASRQAQSQGFILKIRSGSQLGKVKTQTLIPLSKADQGSTIYIDMTK